MTATAVILPTNIVTVSASIQVPWKQDRKGIVYTIKSKFVHQKKVHRYIGETGAEEPMTIDRAKIFDLNKEVDRRNYETLLLNLEADAELSAIIQVKDDSREADEFVKQEMRVSEVTERLMTLYKAKDFETLRNIYRRKYMSANGVTDTMILQSLVKLTKDSPEEVEGLLKDAEAGTIVLIDMAVEKGILVREGEMFSNANNQVVATSEKAMVHYVDTNPDFRATLSRLTEQAFKESESRKAPAQHPLLKLPDADLSSVGVFSDAEDDIRDTGTLLTKEDILHITKLGVKSQMIDNVNDKYLVHRQEFTRKELDEFYLNNAGEAKQLKDELEAAGLWIERA